MLRKNDEIICTVNSTGNNGEGVVKLDFYVIFVPFCLPKEKIKCKILKVDKNIAFGKLLEVLEPSTDRIVPKCPVFGKCGGCQLQHINYESQIKLKEQTIKDAFSKIAFLNVDVKNCVFDDRQYRYRNKLQLPVCQLNDKTVIGFYSEGTHRVIPIDDCLINPCWTSIIINCLNNYMQTYSLKGYNEFNNSGNIREITVREVNDSLIITLVVLKNNLPNLDYFINQLKQLLPNKFSLYINVNKAQTNVVYGDDFYLVYGDANYQSQMLGINFQMGVRSFMQVNSNMCEKLYSYVVSNIPVNQNAVVIDAYSGAGLMTALLSKNAKKAIGIEIIPEAVEMANQLAIDNNLQNKITNYLGKCEEILPSVVEQESKNSNVYVVLDPPRKGCDIKVINALLKSNVSTIVYVSCKPQTLARDVGLLCGSLQEIDGKIVKSLSNEGVYDLKSLTPFDLFAQTKHVETVAVLTRKK